MLILFNLSIKWWK